jgi:hypothetical protein
MPRGGAQVLGWLGKQAEGKVRRDGGNGDDGVRWRVAGARKKGGEGFL